MSALDRINHQLECHAEASSTLLSDIFERLKALEAQFADFRAHNSAISRQEAQTGNNVVLEKQVEIEVLADDQEKSCDGVSCQPDRPPPHIECRYHIDAITTSEQSEALQGLVHKLQEELQQTAMNVEKQLREADERFSRINATCDAITCKLMDIQVKPPSSEWPQLATKVALGQHLHHIKAMMLAKTVSGAAQRAISVEAFKNPAESQVPTNPTAGTPLDNTLVDPSGEASQQDAVDLEEEQVLDSTWAQKHDPGINEGFSMRQNVDAESEGDTLSNFVGSIDDTGLVMGTRAEVEEILLFQVAQLEKQQVDMELSLADIRRQLNEFHGETNSALNPKKESTIVNNFIMDWQSNVNDLRDELIEITKQFMTKSDFHAFIETLPSRNMQRRDDVTITRSSKNIRMTTAASRTFLATPTRTKLEVLDPLFVLTTSAPTTKPRLHPRLGPLHGPGPTIELTGKRLG